MLQIRNILLREQGWFSVRNHRSHTQKSACGVKVPTRHKKFVYKKVYMEFIFSGFTEVCGHWSARYSNLRETGLDRPALHAWNTSWMHSMIADHDIQDASDKGLLTSALNEIVWIEPIDWCICTDNEGRSITIWVLKFVKGISCGLNFTICL